MLRSHGLHPALGLSKASPALLPTLGFTLKGTFLSESITRRAASTVRGWKRMHARDLHRSGRAPWALASLSLVTARVEAAGTSFCKMNSNNR